jgi:hypothetical protein
VSEDRQEWQLDPDFARVVQLRGKLNAPTIDSIQYLLDVFIEGGYTEEGDEVHLNVVHRWLTD